MNRRRRIADKGGTIGHRVLVARRTLGLSQRELSKHTHVHVSTISDIENDKHVPRRNTLRLLADVLDLSFDELLKLLGENSSRPRRRNLSAMLWLMPLAGWLDHEIGFCFASKYYEPLGIDVDAVVVLAVFVVIVWALRAVVSRRYGQTRDTCAHRTSHTRRTSLGVNSPPRPAKNCRTYSTALRGAS